MAEHTFIHGLKVKVAAAAAHGAPHERRSESVGGRLGGQASWSIRLLGLLVHLLRVLGAGVAGPLLLLLPLLTLGCCCCCCFGRGEESQAGMRAGRGLGWAATSRVQLAHLQLPQQYT